MIALLLFALIGFISAACGLVLGLCLAAPILGHDVRQQLRLLGNEIAAAGYRWTPACGDLLGAAERAAGQHNGRWSQ